MVDRFPLKLILKSTILIIFLVIFDQITKILAVRALAKVDSIPLINGVLEFYFIKNTGAAFSFLTGHTWFFLVITPIILILILIFAYRLPKTKRFLPLYICILFIVSGAIGNFIDRISLGYVRDFIYFSLIDFPVFNVADIYVTCSVFVLAFLFIFVYKDEEFETILKFRGKK